MEKDNPVHIYIIDFGKAFPNSPVEDKKPFLAPVSVEVGLPLAALERQHTLDNIRGALGRLRKEIEEIESWDPLAGNFRFGEEQMCEGYPGMYLQRVDVLAAIDREIEKLEARR